MQGQGPVWPRPRTFAQGQGQGQGLKICPRGQLKGKDQGQGQQHWTTGVTPCAGSREVEESHSWPLRFLNHGTRRRRRRRRRRYRIIGPHQTETAVTCRPMLTATCWWNIWGISLPSFSSSSSFSFPSPLIPHLPWWLVTYRSRSPIQALTIGCRDVVTISTSWSRDAFSQRLGLCEMWERRGLGLVSGWKPNVSVSDLNVSFTSLIFGTTESTPMQVYKRCHVLE